MNRASTDRNLLYGIFALQLDFVDRDSLVEGMQAWVLDKSRDLGDIFVAKGRMKAEQKAMLDPLVKAHIASQDGDASKSLQTLSSVSQFIDALGDIADSDLQETLHSFAPTPPVQIAGPAARNSTACDRNADAQLIGGRFQILREHATGGLGRVFLAKDIELNREIALKQIRESHADDAEARARFLIEAEVTGSLEHPGIVPVYGLGHYDDGRPFYAMRFVRGSSLKDQIDRFHRRGRQTKVTPVVRRSTNRDAADRSAELHLDETATDPPAKPDAFDTALPTGADRAPSIEGVEPANYRDFASTEFRALLRRFIDVCNAIGYAHSRGVLHRDLKPGNVMLGKYGETLVVDWGLAKTLSAVANAESSLGPFRPTGSGSAETLPGSALGTPAFMSPEQAAGRLDELGPTTDVYSLGATLYYLLTGAAPFKGSAAEVIRRVGLGEFPKPRQINAAIPRDLDAVCVKAMALLPAHRYPNCADLVADLESHLADEPVVAWREPLRVKTRRWLKKNRTLSTSLAVATGLLLAASAVGFALVSTAYRSERSAKQLAETKEREADGQRLVAEQQSKLADANRREARTAIDDLFTKVAEATELKKSPATMQFRRLLLLRAKEYYEKVAAATASRPEELIEAAGAFEKLAAIESDLNPGPATAELLDKARALRRRAGVPDGSGDLVRRFDEAMQLANAALPSTRWRDGFQHFDEAISLAQRIAAATPRDAVAALRPAEASHAKAQAELDFGQPLRALALLQAADASAEAAQKVHPDSKPIALATTRIRIDLSLQLEVFGYFARARTTAMEARRSIRSVATADNLDPRVQALSIMADVQVHAVDALIRGGDEWGYRIRQNDTTQVNRLIDLAEGGSASSDESARIADFIEQRRLRRQTDSYGIYENQDSTLVSRTVLGLRAQLLRDEPTSLRHAIRLARSLLHFEPSVYSDLDLFYQRPDRDRQGDVGIRLDTCLSGIARLRQVQPESPVLKLYLADLLRFKARQSFWANGNIGSSHLKRKQSAKLQIEVLTPVLNAATAELRDSLDSMAARSKLLRFRHEIVAARDERIYRLTRTFCRLEAASRWNAEIVERFPGHRVALGWHLGGGYGTIPSSRMTDRERHFVTVHDPV